MSELPSIDLVILKLREIVDEYGADHVYRKHHNADDFGYCLYVFNGEPDCIIGKLLVKLGFTVDQLAANEGEGAPQVFANLYGWDHFDMTNPSSVPDVIMLAYCVQVQQDGGRTWGQAVSDGIQEVMSDSTMVD